MDKYKLKYYNHSVCSKYFVVDCMVINSWWNKCIFLAFDDFISYVNHKSILNMKAKAKKRFKEAKAQVESVSTNVFWRTHEWLYLLSEGNIKYTIRVTEESLSRSCSG